jgi:hypothetical protein
MAIKDHDSSGRTVRYVYDDKISRILGRPVLTDPDTPDTRFVYLTNAEAQLYIDNGAIGNIPLADQDADAQSVIQQATGAPLTGSETPDPDESPIDREAFIDQPLTIDETPEEEL